MKKIYSVAQFLLLLCRTGCLKKPWSGPAGVPEAPGITPADNTKRVKTNDPGQYTDVEPDYQSIRFAVNQITGPAACDVMRTQQTMIVLTCNGYPVRFSAN